MATDPTDPISGHGGVTSDSMILYDRMLKLINDIMEESSGGAGPHTHSYQDEAFYYDRFGVPASTWIINHNKGYPVTVTIILDSGVQVQADIVHNPAFTTTTITFPTPFAGKVVLI